MLLSAKTKLWGQQFQAIQGRVIDSGLEHVVFAAFEEAAQGLPVDNLDEVAIPYMTFVTKNRFNPGGQPYCSLAIWKPTWLDLCMLAEDAIMVTNDYSRKYLKGVTHRGVVRPEKGVYIEVFSLELER